MKRSHWQRATRARQYTQRGRIGKTIIAINSFPIGGRLLARNDPLDETAVVALSPLPTCRPHANTFLDLMASCVLLYFRARARVSLGWAHRTGEKRERDVEMAWMSCLGDDRCRRDKENKNGERKGTEVVLATIGKTKGRWINPVMACNRESRGSRRLDKRSVSSRR